MNPIQKEHRRQLVKRIYEQGAKINNRRGSYISEALNRGLENKPFPKKFKKSSMLFAAWRAGKDLYNAKVFRMYKGVEISFNPVYRYYILSCCPEIKHHFWTLKECKNYITDMFETEEQ